MYSSFNREPSALKKGIQMYSRYRTFGSLSGDRQEEIQKEFNMLVGKEVSIPQDVLVSSQNITITVKGLYSRYMVNNGCLV